MASKTEILNMALSHLGISKDVANIDTEQGSEEATAGRRFYDIARDYTATRIAWPFLAKLAALALIEKTPNSEWAFSYRYPSDCKYMKRILSGIRNDSRQTRSPYKIAQDTGGLVIFSDVENAELEYSVVADNPQLYSSDFTLAFSQYLGVLMAPRVTKGDQFNLAAKTLELFRLTVSQAQARALNEEQVEEEPDAEFIRARN